mmetsp:Transcript_52835/g.153959  ORF Transcript_52835/g.153959 Transcript_52835/m.153959 type:complete len:209 (+) Transcript_52835:726-1352(+)
MQALLRHLVVLQAGFGQVDELQALVPPDGLAERELEAGGDRHVAEVQHAQVHPCLDQGHGGVNGVRTGAQAVGHVHLVEVGYPRLLGQMSQQRHKPLVRQQRVAREVDGFDELDALNRGRHREHLAVDEILAGQVQALLPHEQRQRPRGHLPAVALLQVPGLARGERRQDLAAAPHRSGPGRALEATRRTFFVVGFGRPLRLAVGQVR